MTTRTPRIEQVRFTDPATQALVDEVQAEYTVLYGGPDDAPIEDGVFDPPRGAFLLAYVDGADVDGADVDGADVDGVAVAMGGWRLRSDVHPWGLAQTAEIKRMYVAPAARRRGYARLVLAQLEETARAAGAEAMVLETGTAQPEAIAMYLATGYSPIEKFGHYTWSPQQRCFGKPL